MATVTSSFLSAVAARSWTDADGGSLRATDGSISLPCAAPSQGHSNAWMLASFGAANTFNISHAVYVSLVGATANADGSFTTPAGVVYWLGLNAAGTAVADLPSGPPPP